MVKKAESVNPKDGDSILCLSYIPLMYASNAGSFFDTQDILNVAADYIQTGVEVSLATACLWAQPHTEITPVFILERGDDIYQHLKIWAEGDITKWFTMDIVEQDLKYAICLHPRLDRSAERLAQSYKLRSGRDMPKTGLRYIYVPLTFVSDKSETFQEIKSRITNLCYLGILDTKKFDKSNPMDVKEDDIHFIGPFQVRRDPEDTGEYLRSRLPESN